VREYLAGVEGAAVPGVLPRAWDNYMRTRTVPAEVAAWNTAHPAGERPAYDATAAVDEEIRRTGLPRASAYTS
jgi:hypothetical protein